MGAFLPNELEKLLLKSGVPFKRKSRSFLLDCPRCNKRQKLWILQKNGAFVCWHCKETDNFKGWADEAISEVIGMDRQQVRSHIYENSLPPGNLLEFDLGLFGADESDLVDLQSEQVPIPEIEWPYDTVPLQSKAGEKGLAYLRGRGIPLEVALYYKMVYWPSARRVMFPVIVDGLLVGYQGRAIDAGREPKILTSSGLRREYVLMFQDRLKRAKHAVICEGPVDAIKASLCGGNVATMGKAVSKPQLEIVRKMGISKVYLALDPDAAEEVQRLAFELGDMETRLLLPPNGKKDLGECSFEEVLDAFKDAKPFTAGNLLFDLKV